MDDLEKAKKAALRLLSFRPRSENELRKKLGRKGLAAEAVERTVEELRRARMLDDARFAKLYALSRMQSRAYGKARVRRELAQKGLSGGDVAEAMQSVAEIDELGVALEIARKRLASLKGLAPQAKKRRIHGLLLRRGFGADVTFKVLNRLLGATEEF